ncbi:MAG: uroporphyrinogen decarboxylase [Planctomycetes bacterium]|nr:uroporphyrinogen decarboxylase [Planctomycetota bacterium]
MPTKSNLLLVLGGKKSQKTPVWMMRQAGRYLPEYRKTRERHTFLEMCHNPELAAEVTLQPIRRYGFDAAILFSDILVFLPFMGLDVAFPETGPKIAKPVKSAADVDALTDFDGPDCLSFQADALRLVKKELPENVALIGFAGAPFTLACYAVNGRGSKDWSETKSFLYANPEAGRKLLEKLSNGVIASLDVQIDAGAEVVQIFDSWAGVLSREDFEEFSKPFLTRITKHVKSRGVPIIQFARGIPSGWQTGCEPTAFQIDYVENIAEAAGNLAPRPVQGNLDPATLLAGREVAVAKTAAILEKMRGKPFIFNLGHGVIKETDPDVIAAVVDRIRM